MDLTTTNKTNYKGKPTEKGLPKHKEVVGPAKPIVQTSSYKASFPDWNNGKNDVFHEKHPQFPFYSLPFQGESTYAKHHTERQIKELKKQQARDAANAKSLK